MLLLSASQTLHIILYSWYCHCTLCVTTASVVLATGRRLAELELVLLLVQVCVPMSIAVCNGVQC